MGHVSDGASIGANKVTPQRTSGQRHIAVLEAGGPDGPLEKLLCSLERLSVRHVQDVESLRLLLLQGAIDAVVVDPELPEGWPITVSRQVAELADGVAPLIIVCRNDLDEQQIASHVKRHNVVVVSGTGLSPDRVDAILAGEWAKPSKYR